MALPRSVLITGANRGIGLGFVKYFLAKEPNPELVFATCRSPRGSEATKELDDLAKAHQGRLHIVQMDVGDPPSVERAAADVAAVTGESGLNLLINNAGIFPKMSTLDDVDPERLLQCFSINTVGPMATARALRPLLKRAAAQDTSGSMSWSRSAIVNMSSELGTISKNTRGGSYGYRASKAALNQLTKTLSIDLRQEGILAISICPGWVQTDMGTQSAHLTVESSVASVVETLSKLSDSDSGGFVNRHGKTVAF